MEFTEIQTIIVRLKAVQASNPKEYSIKNIMNALKERKAAISETTLRRIFAENSEIEDSFSYKSIQPVAELLIHDEPEDVGLSQHLNIAHAKIDLLLAVIDGKNGQIERQSDKIGQLTAQVDRLLDQLNTIRSATDKRIELLEQRITFLLDQINIKDRRMDEQRARQDDKDALIVQLMKDKDALMNRLLELLSSRS